MTITLGLTEMVAELNVLLRPHGFSLVEQPAPGGKAHLTHPDLEEVVKTRAFLNHGLSGTCHSGIVLGLSHKPTELTVESGFKTLLSCPFEPERLAGALMQAGQELLRSHRAFLAASNPLHLQLLEHREAITQAGFHLEPTFFVANLETYRELKRTTEDRTDLIGLSLDPEGQLVATRLQSVFTRPVPFTTAMKVMGLGVAKGPSA